MKSKFLIGIIIAVILIIGISVNFRRSGERNGQDDRRRDDESRTSAGQ
ncbi:MAG: hypothetical protein HW401_833 [Parcubacteria group bacterium]|nr:hypothetical protein [Parcubacteria group bacterium]